MAGLAGAGKTTAISLLRRAGVGVRLYVGSVVLDEVRRRRLPETPENEKAVRAELRASGGADALARAALPLVEAMVGLGDVLLDAIYCEPERRLYADRFGAALIVVAIVAPHALRAERLRARRERPMTTEELAARDEYETTTLGIGDVIASADRRIANDRGLDEFEGALKLALGGG